MANWVLLFGTPLVLSLRLLGDPMHCNDDDDEDDDNSDDDDDYISVVVFYTEGKMSFSARLGAK